MPPVAAFVFFKKGPFRKIILRNLLRPSVCLCLSINGRFCWLVPAENGVGHCAIWRGVARNGKQEYNTFVVIFCSVSLPFLIISISSAYTCGEVAD